jgi:hypothetical protein
LVIALELRGREHPERRVSPAAVEEDLDVLEHLGPQLGLGGPRAAVDELLLEGREEALGDGFDRRVKDLRAAGELHLLDEVPRGSVSLYDYTYDVWWPQYAETNLSDETRATYATQLDLRIMPKWGKHPVRTLEPAPIEAWVSQLRKDGVGDATILKTLAVFRAILKRAERTGKSTATRSPWSQSRSRSPSARHGRSRPTSSSGCAR